MNGWGQHLDNLADVTARLLAHGLVRTDPLVDPQAAMAARDAVVGQLRALVGLVADISSSGQVRDLTLHDITRRPAQALHQALSELPRAVEFGAGGQLSDPAERTATEYERLWQSARRATVGLEGYTQQLAQAPDIHGWDIMRDLTDLAAAVPYLDQDLSEAILHRSKAGEDLTASYRMLTHEGHDALRVITGEIRSRVPADEPQARAVSSPAPTTTTMKTAGDERRSVRATGEVAPRPPGAGRLRPAQQPQDAGDLAETITRLTYAIGSRGANVSLPEVKAVARLLQDGSAHAATVLDRAAPAIAAEAARCLRDLIPAAGRLLDAPARSMSEPRVDLVGVGNALLARMNAAAEQAARLPAGASEQDLRRLAAPAVEFAQHVPALARAVDLSVRQAVASGVMLVPGIADPRSTTSLSWVTARMARAQAGGPPRILTAADEVTTSAGRMTPAIRHVGAELVRTAGAWSDPQQLALVAARRHAGAARGELRTALNSRIVGQPAPLAGQWPAHPRTAPPRTTGPQR